MLMRVIYFSSQTYTLKPSDLRLLLKQCQSNNKRDNLTGLLIYKDGSFCQTVEGEELPMANLITRLKNDGRHKNILILDYKAMKERRFARWSMAFENFSSKRVNAMNLGDLSAYLHQKFELSEERDLVPHMLAAFSRSLDPLDGYHDVNRLNC